jgi:hypothetical protein
MFFLCLTLNKSEDLKYVAFVIVSCSLKTLSPVESALHSLLFDIYIPNADLF